MGRDMGQRGFWCSIFLLVQILFFWVSGSMPAQALSSEQQLVLQAWRTVNQAYYDEGFNHQNWWKVRDNTIKQSIPDRETAYRTIEKMLASLDEPFTRLLRPEQYRSLQVNTSGELFGVGLQIGIREDSKQIEVIAPIAGSPADKAGIKTHDLIVKVDATPSTEMDLDTAAAKMRGPAGTNISLTIQSPGKAPKEFILERQKISLRAVISELRREKSQPVGYIRLTQFSAKASSEMATAIQDLAKQGARSYVLDLRNNPGGLVTAGVEIAKMWLNDVPIVYTVNRQGILEDFAAGHEALTDRPLAVLVNSGTASASEILAGALQDNQRATIVGTQSFGKGLIQSLFELPDGSGMAVTVAKYETPLHQDIHKKGITPQVVVKEDTEGKTDAVYAAAIATLDKPA
jgi:carboxyl-terminal processing protease